MAKYHINLNGQPAACRASERSCPRGGVDEHFSSKEAAYDAIAASHDGTFLTSTKREDTVSADIRAAEEFYGGRFVTPHSIELEPGVQAAIDDLREVGNPLIVGGAVRDSFEGHSNKDIDIEVHGATVDGIIELLRKKGYHVDEVGKKFGVLKASKGDVTDLDVSVPRKENRTGAGHRNFEVELDDSMTVSEAAERRDFTFNGVMYDPQRGMLIDPAGGREDFENKIMRHVSEKFSEDPLRVLRGFQFAGRFGMKYAPETAELCKGLRSEYSDLSVERVREEWTKYFTKSTHPEMGVTALQESGWDDTIPGLQTALAASKTYLARLPKVPKEDRAIVGAALIGRQYKGADTQKLFDAILVDNDSRRKAKVLMASDSESLAESSYNRKMFALEASKKKADFALYESYAIATGDIKGIKAARLAKADGVFEKPEKPFADGDEIMALTDRKPGRWLGEVMSEVLDKQYRGEIKSKDDALRFAKSLI